MNEVKPDPEIEVIENPSLRSIPRIIGEWGVTVLIWAFWVYLLSPLLSLGLWLLGIHFFYREVVVSAGYVEFFVLVRKLGLVVMSVFLLLRFWGLYNYWFFGRRNRRNQVEETSFESLSRIFRLPVKVITELQDNKEIYWPPHMD